MLGKNAGFEITIYENWQVNIHSWSSRFLHFFPIFPFAIYSDKSIRIKIILNGGKMHMPFYHL